MADVAWVGLVVTVIAFAVDGILWSFVFNQGMEHLMHMSRHQASKSMGRLMSQSFVAQLIFGYFFSAFWAMVGHALPAKGVLGGLEFGLLMWIPTVAYSALSNSLWYGKSRSLASATAWTALVKFLVCGVALSLMI